MFLSVKVLLKVLLITEMLKPSDLYVFFLLKLAHMGKIDWAKYISFFDKKWKTVWFKYNETWKKISNIIMKEFDRKPLYNEKHLKTCNGKINTNFHHKKYQKKVLNVFV